MTAFIESSAQSDTANLELTSHDYDLPVDIVEGELILSIIALGANGKDPKITAVDNGWQILREISDNSVNFAVLGKVASAGEVGPANLTTDVACVTAHITHRISGWAGGLSCVVVSPGFSQKSLEPNPDLVEAGWDLTDNLFIVGTTAHRNSSVLTYPTGYVDNQISFSTGGGGNETMVATASQDIDSTFDNPDVFTILSSFWHIAVTIVVGPAGACEIVTFNSAYPIRQQLRRAMFHS